MANEELDSTDKGLKSLKESARDVLNPLDAIGKSIARMTAGADGLNKSFGLSRARIQEMNIAFADSSVEVLKFGGDLRDTQTTITDIASASRRNVIENKKVVGELYAASQVLGIETKTLVNNFKDVGYETSQIGPNLEKSITYIQSVGLNAREVMADVNSNMDKMNRYQFNGGVAGLAKMAAHASMLRFDMNQTFNLADDVLDPARAIDVAASFQRLGVSVGNLIDPFQLMNQSINDPSGLQKSLEDVAKSFTYFDEQTQSFKINPQGVLTLREMEKQTGVSAKEMSKMGLAAADLDRRLSQVSAAGLKFENEEDKQYLANIAAMGKGGKYEVTLEDDTKKELQNLNQEEFNKLIDQQKNAPKTIEDIQRSQLGFAETLAADASSILALLKFSIGKSPDVRTNIEGFRNVLTSISGTAQKKIGSKDEDIQKVVDDGLTSGFKMLEEIASGKMSSTDLLSKFTEIQTKIISNASGISGEAIKKVQELLKESAQKVKGNSYIEQMFKDTMGVVSSGVSASGKKGGVQSQIKTKQVAPVSKNAIMGTATTLKNYSESSTPTKTGSPLIGQVGPINVPPPPQNYSLEQQKQWKEYFEGPEFARAITEIVDKQNKKLERTK
jgi:hypothetical protein